VFTWDITKAAGPVKGIWYHAYVIIDIFSRYSEGHTVEAAESAERAEELIRETITRNSLVPQTVHADRGTSMTSKKVSQLLIDLGVTRSHSQPKVSNDNPHNEAQIKTTKYMSDYPERFDSLAHAREWFDASIACYSHEHRHSGIGWHTPASVHFGTAEEVRDQRAITLTEAYNTHPERFGRRPRPPEIPQQAWINDPAKHREPAPQTSEHHNRLGVGWRRAMKRILAAVSTGSVVGGAVGGKKERCVAGGIAAWVLRELGRRVASVKAEANQ
jgi:putative transposase